MGLTQFSESSDKWNAYDNWVEIDGDKTSYSAASPENALVFIGPARRTSLGNSLSIANIGDNLIPVGLLQDFTINQAIAWTPQMMIGSARTFFLAGNAPGNGTLTRLFTSASTILGAIYKLAITKSGALKADFDSAPWNSDSESKQIIFNMESELLRVPFGIAALFRDTARTQIGGFYIESAVIPAFSFGLAAQAPAIFETVQIMFDRVLPFNLTLTKNDNNLKTKLDEALEGGSDTTA